MKDDVANTAVKNTTVKNSYQEEEKEIANEPIEIETQVEAQIES